MNGYLESIDTTTLQRSLKILSGISNGTKQGIDWREKGLVSEVTNAIIVMLCRVYITSSQCRLAGRGICARAHGPSVPLVHLKVSIRS